MGKPPEQRSRRAALISSSFCLKPARNGGERSFELGQIERVLSGRAEAAYRFIPRMGESFILAQPKVGLLTRLETRAVLA